MARQAVILCGGLGSRLGALAAKTPKPLLPVGGAPFLDVLLFELGRHGIKRVLLLAGHAAERVLDYAASTALKSRFDLEIDVSVEPQRAGTGGALWHARDRLDDQFLLLNGDSWFDVNLLDFARRATRETSATGGIAVRLASGCFALRGGRTRWRPSDWFPRAPRASRRRARQRRGLFLSARAGRGARALLLAGGRCAAGIGGSREAAGPAVRRIFHRYRGTRLVCPRAARGAAAAASARPSFSIGMGY